MRAYPTARISRLSTTAPEPVSLAEAKLHCRVDAGTEDTLIGALITAAREYCEALTGASLIVSSYRLELSRFPDSAGDIVLPRRAIINTIQVQYVDPSGTTITMTSGTDYRLVNNIMPPRVRRPYAAASVLWPRALEIDDAVQITFSTTVAVPAQAKQAILLLVGHWYANRESVVTGTITSELQQTTKALLSSFMLGEICP